MTSVHPARAARGLSTIAAILALWTVGPGKAEESQTPWSYSGATGPGQWAGLSPEFRACAEGRSQSPVDIRQAERLPYVPLAFQYRALPLEATNDGHGVTLPIPPGNELRIRGKGYALQEIRLHAPGEHRLDGKAAAAEIQLVHRSAEGAVAVVAIQVRPSSFGNATLTRIVERLPLLPGERLYFRQVGVNPLFILPSRRSYLAYSGSLTWPPCSEPVSWILLTEPVDLEPKLIERLARATGVNARPEQPLEGRPVYAYPLP